MSDTKWIVKSSGRILGPCSIDEIAEQIRQRTFSVLDEVREPHTRWMFLREHPMLAKVVKQIREEQATSIENTQSTFVTSGRTVTSSVTERIELTPTPTPEDAGIPTMKSIVGSEKTIPSAVGGAKSFGVLSDQKVQHQLERQNSQWRYIAYGLGVLAVVGATLYWKTQTRSGLSAEKATELMQNAKTLASYGEYGLALKTTMDVEAARGLSAADKLLKLKLLFVLDESSPLEMNRAYEELAATGQGGLAINLDLLQGLAQSRLGRIKEAQASYQRALERNRNSEEALLNLSASYLVGGEISKAWQYLNSMKFTEHRPYYQVLKSLVAIHWEDPTTQREIQQQAFEEFKGFDHFFDAKVANDPQATYRGLSLDQVRLEDAGRDLRFERLMLLSLIARRLGRTDVAEAQQRKMLQTNPLDGKNYLRSPLLDWQIMNWSRLKQYCETMKKSQGDSSTIRSILSQCLAAAGDLVGARSLIESAAKQFQGDTSVVAVDALLLEASGRISEAERMVQMYAVTDRTLLHWVRGSICEGEDKQNVPCAEQAWTQVNNIDPFEPRALYGLATAAGAMMNDQKRRESSTLGLKFAPNYIPLLRISNVKNEF